MLSSRLPELQEELQRLIQQTEEGLRHLPKPPSQDAIGEIIHLVADFVRDLGVCMEGTPDQGGLLQALRPHQDAFKGAILATAPDFRPSLKPKKVTPLWPEGKLPRKPTTSEDDSDDDDGTDAEPATTADAPLAKRSKKKRRAAGK